MKNILKIVLISLLLLPSTTFGAFAVGFNATSTTQGWISPNLVNGILQVPVANQFLSSFFTATSTTVASTFAGNVGIGTTTPSLPLVVGGSRPFSVSTAQGFTSLQASTGGWGMLYGFKGSTGTDVGGYGAVGGSGSLTRYYIGDVTTNERMSILTGGNVGIGTTSPVSKLTVTDTSNIYSGLFQGNSLFGVGIGGGTTSGQIQGFNNLFAVSDLVLQAGGGDVGIGSSTPWGKLSITQSNGGPSFLVEDSTSPDTTPFIIDSAGNVGIGTVTPVEKLSVYGAVNTVIGSFFAPLADTNYSVLKLGKSAGANESAVMTYIYDTTTNDQYVGFGISGITDVFGYTGSSRFSVGTSTPNAKVQINGSGAEPTNLLELGNFSQTSTRYNFTMNNDGVLQYIQFKDTGSGTDGLVLNSAGRIGIGTTSPSHKLTVNGSTYLAGAVLATSTVVMTGLTGATAGTNQDVCITTAGNLINETTGTCIVSSERFKKDIETLDLSGIDTVMKLKPVEYSYKEDDVSDYEDRQYGLTAEQVAEIDPHLAKYGIDGLPRTLDDRALISVLIKAVQEQQKEIELLKAKLK